MVTPTEILTLDSSYSPCQPVRRAPLPSDPLALPAYDPITAAAIADGPTKISVNALVLVGTQSGRLLLYDAGSDLWVASSTAHTAPVSPDAVFSSQLASMCLFISLCLLDSSINLFPLRLPPVAPL